MFQLISLAVADKLSALQTYDLIADRAKHSSRERFFAAMALVPEGEVIPGDELPKKFEG